MSVGLVRPVANEFRVTLGGEGGGVGGGGGGAGGGGGDGGGVVGGAWGEVLLWRRAVLFTFTGFWASAPKNIGLARQLHVLNIESRAPERTELSIRKLWL